MTDPTAIERYAAQLKRRTDAERQEIRERAERQAAATEERAPRRTVLQGEWTLLALDAEDPADALREAVATSTDDPTDVEAVLLNFDAIAEMWDTAEQYGLLLLEAEAATASPEETRRIVWTWCQKLAARDLPDELRTRVEETLAELDAAPVDQAVPPGMYLLAEALRRAGYAG